MKKNSTPNSDWQRIWFSARHRDWTSLALVPSDAGVDVGRIADMLATTGRLHGERHVTVVSATGVPLEGVQAIVDSIAVSIGRGEIVVIPVDPVADNPGAIAILRACSAAILVVRLGESQFTTAQHTIDIVDRERFLGSIVLEQEGRHLLATAEPTGLEL